MKPTGHEQPPLPPTPQSHRALPMHWHCLHSEPKWSATHSQPVPLTPSEQLERLGAPGHAHGVHDGPQCPALHTSQSTPSHPAAHVHAPVPERPQSHVPPAPHSHGAQLLP